MSELKVIVRHASTVLVGQLAVMAFGVADTIIAGRYSDTALAALSVGSAIYISVYVGLIGIVQALLPVWAEMLGAGKHSAIGRSLRQGLYLCGFITLAGMAALLFPAALLRWAQVPASMMTEVENYLTVLAFAFAPAILFRLYSTFNQSLGKPVLVTWLQVGALGIKIPLSMWLVAGGAGFEPMGAVGCAWATLLVNYLLVLLAFVTLRTQTVYQPFHIWRPIETPDWPVIGHFARLGLPGGLAYLVEVTSFTLMALFIARLGTSASASHQIAASMAAVLYMLPLSTAIACSARVSFWLGAGKADLAKRVVWLGLRLTAFTSAALAAMLLIASSYIASLYSTNPVIIAMAASLLGWVAAYHLADSAQAVCAFLLRCYGVTVAPLVIYGVLLWGLGLYGGYLLTYEGIAGVAARPVPASFWAVSTIALWLVAISFMALLWRTVHKSSNPGAVKNHLA